MSRKKQILGEPLEERVNDLYKRLNLLLNHLNLQYIPESTETKGARLEEKNKRKGDWAVNIEDYLAKTQ